MRLGMGFRIGVPHPPLFISLVSAFNFPRGPACPHRAVGPRSSVESCLSARTHFSSGRPHFPVGAVGLAGPGPAQTPGGHKRAAHERPPPSAGVRATCRGPPRLLEPARSGALLYTPGAVFFVGFLKNSNTQADVGRLYG